MFILGLLESVLVDFLLVLTERFSLGVTAEALRAKVDRKSAISLQRGQFDPKFQVEGVDPTNHFWTDFSDRNVPVTVCSVTPCCERTAERLRPNVDQNDSGPLFRRSGIPNIRHPNPNP